MHACIYLGGRLNHLSLLHATLDTVQKAMEPRTEILSSCQPGLVLLDHRDGHVA